MVITAEEVLRNAKPKKISIEVKKDVQLEYDLRRLFSFDPTEATETDEERLKDNARDNLQLFFTKLHDLGNSSRITLPSHTITLPREKPLPKPKQKTRWETFRDSRGIKKRKRSKAEFDEDTQTWKRRYGYDKANDINNVPIIEHKEGADPSEDPWSKAAREKKDNVSWNKNKRVQNMKAATGNRVAGTLDLGDAIEATSKKNFLKKSRRKKHHVDAALQIAQNSTVSMGKFDKKHKHEPKQKRRREKVGKRTMSFKKEKGNNMDILSSVLGSKHKVNHDKLANIGQQEENKKRQKQKGKKRKGRS